MWVIARSFDEFLDGPLALPPEHRRFARMMAESFDAADTSRASARAIAAEWTGETLGAGPQSRPVNGYGSLLAALSVPLRCERLRLQLHSRVHHVAWSAGAVEVRGEFAGVPFRVRAARALVSLPLGVLQQPMGAASAVEFVPALPGKQAALQQLASGPVTKVLLRFAAPFWETIAGGRYRDAAFFHAPGSEVPTFWTAAPSPAPLLVAWAGGPRAPRLSARLAQAGVARTVSASLSALFGPEAAAAARLEGYYHHDWQHDPFARGAYSYLLAGGEGAREELGRTIADTLFFAGEATDTGGEAGTVNGALQSGLRAARELLAR